MSEWFCVAGHDKNVFGVYGKGQCKECDRIRKRHRRSDKRFAHARSIKRRVPLTQLEGVRNELGVTTTDVARASGLSRGFVRALETGRRQATPWVQKAIVEAVVKLRRERENDRGSVQK